MDTMNDSSSKITLKMDDFDNNEEIQSEKAFFTKEREKLNQLYKDIQVIKDTLEFLKYYIMQDTDNKHTSETSSPKPYKKHSECETNYPIAKEEENVVHKSKGNSSVGKKFKNFFGFSSSKNTTLKYGGKDNDCTNNSEEKVISEDGFNEKSYENMSISSASNHYGEKSYPNDKRETKDVLDANTTQMKDKNISSPNQDLLNASLETTKAFDLNSTTCQLENTSSKQCASKEAIEIANTEAISKEHESSKEKSFSRETGYSADVTSQVIELNSLDDSKNGNIKLTVFGCSGYGKSSTINSLLGFPCIYTSSKTQRTEQIPVLISTVVNGVRVSCVDTPGIEENKVMSLLETIYKSLDLVNYSFSGLLLVLKYGERFTQQTKSIVTNLKGLLGEKIIENCCVCVITNGDQFADDMRQSDDPLSFEEWCRKQDPEIGMLFQECQYRCVLFDNKTRDESKIQSQYNKMISIVRTIKGYDKSDFESTNKVRECFLSKCSLPEITENANEVINTFRQKHESIETIEDNGVKISELNSLLIGIDEFKSNLPLQAGNIQHFLDVLRLEIESKRKCIEHNKLYTAKL